MRKVFAKALAGLSQEALTRLGDLPTVVGLWPAQAQQGIVLDFDSSTIISFGKQQGAGFGYCGRG